MAFAFPESFRLADSHEYANADGDLVRVGISAFAVDQLGDIVFVDLPDVGGLDGAVGDRDVVLLSGAVVTDCQRFGHASRL